MNISNSTKNFLQQNVTSDNECDCKTQQECKFMRHGIMLLIFDQNRNINIYVIS